MIRHYGLLLGALQMYLIQVLIRGAPNINPLLAAFGYGVVVVLCVIYIAGGRSGGE